MEFRDKASKPAVNQPANQPATGQPGSEGNTGSWADDLEANKETNLTTTLKPLPSTSGDLPGKTDRPTQ